jgi:hypothetical protein
MTEVSVYVCDICEKVSKVKSTISSHESRCRKAKAIAEENAVFTKNRQAEYLNSVFEPSEFHIQAMKWHKKHNNLDFEIIQENLRYSEETSNSHSCPIGGGTNWGGQKKDVPRGYPGWNAHWVIGMSKKTYGICDSFGWLSDLFNCSFPSKVNGLYFMMGAHAGTGGSWHLPGGKQEEYLHYYMTFFAQDFPNLKKYITKETLKGKMKAIKV